MKKKKGIPGYTQKDNMFDHGFHSKSYHSHFEDYKEEYQMDARGKVKLVRTYNGDYYRREMSDSRDLAVKFFHLALYLATIGLYIRVAASTVSANCEWYVFVAEVLTLLAMIWMVRVMIFYLTAKRNLTVGEYRSTSGQLWKTAVVCALGFLLLAICLAIGQLIAGTMEERAESALLITFCIAGALCQAGIVFSEKKIRYIKGVNIWTTKQ